MKMASLVTRIVNVPKSAIKAVSKSAGKAIAKGGSVARIIIRIK
jgi:hypothetical protein